MAGEQRQPAQDLQNIRLVIDIGDNRSVEIPIKGKLILQNSGPSQSAPDAGDKEAADKEKEKEKKEKGEEKFLMQMRGWLMTVGTLFVNMAFQAALHPPDWLRTTDFLRFSLHSAFDATAAPADPARFAPSPSPQAAESATAGLHLRAELYMLSNYITFGTALALVLLLLWKIPPHWAKHTMVGVAIMMVVIALSAVATVALGSTKALIAVFGIATYAALALSSVAMFSVCLARNRARRAGERPPQSPDRAEGTPSP